MPSNNDYDDLITYLKNKGLYDKAYNELKHIIPFAKEGKYVGIYKNENDDVQYPLYELTKDLEKVNTLSNTSIQSELNEMAISPDTTSTASVSSIKSKVRTLKASNTQTTTFSEELEKIIDSKSEEDKEFIRKLCSIVRNTNLTDTSASSNETIPAVARADRLSTCWYAIGALLARTRDEGLGALHNNYLNYSKTADVKDENKVFYSSKVANNYGNALTDDTKWERGIMNSDLLPQRFNIWDVSMAVNSKTITLTSKTPFDKYPLQASQLVNGLEITFTPTQNAPTYTSGQYYTLIIDGVSYKLYGATIGSSYNGIGIKQNKPVKVYYSTNDSAFYVMEMGSNSGCSRKIGDIFWSDRILRREVEFRTTAMCLGQKLSLDDLGDFYNFLVELKTTNPCHFSDTYANWLAEKNANPYGQINKYFLQEGLLYNWKGTFNYKGWSNVIKYYCYKDNEGLSSDILYVKDLISAEHKPVYKYNATTYEMDLQADDGVLSSDGLAYQGVQFERYEAGDRQVGFNYWTLTTLDGNVEVYGDPIETRKYYGMGVISDSGTKLTYNSKTFNRRTDIDESGESHIYFTTTKETGSSLNVYTYNATTKTSTLMGTDGEINAIGKLVFKNFTYDRNDAGNVIHNAYVYLKCIKNIDGDTTLNVNNESKTDDYGYTENYNATTSNTRLNYVSGIYYVQTKLETEEEQTKVLTYKGVVSTIADLPTNASTGDFYYVTGESKFYSSSAGIWYKMENWLDLSKYQQIVDDTLQTEYKTIPTSINELNSYIKKGVNYCGIKYDKDADIIQTNSSSKVTYKYTSLVANNDESDLTNTNKWSRETIMSGKKNMLAYIAAWSGDSLVLSPASYGDYSLTAEPCYGTLISVYVSDGHIGNASSITFSFSGTGGLAGQSLFPYEDKIYSGDLRFESVFMYKGNNIWTIVKTYENTYNKEYLFTCSGISGTQLTLSPTSLNGNIFDVPKNGTKIIIGLNGFALPATTTGYSVVFSGGYGTPIPLFMSDKTILKNIGSTYYRYSYLEFYYWAGLGFYLQGPVTDYQNISLPQSNINYIINVTTRADLVTQLNANTYYIGDTISILGNIPLSASSNLNNVPLPRGVWLCDKFPVNGSISSYNSLGIPTRSVLISDGSKVGWCSNTSGYVNVLLYKVGSNISGGSL